MSRRHMCGVALLPHSICGGQLQTRADQTECSAVGSLRGVPQAAAFNIAQLLTHNSMHFTD
jgi:hypothetical protein